MIRNSGIKRRKTRTISIGKVKIGGTNPIIVQSMTNTKTSDIRATLKQIKRLESAGCELVRIGIPDMKSAVVIPEIISRVNIPVVGDIHFDHRLAIRAIENGIHGIRLNPGNIRDTKSIIKVVEKAKNAKIAIRIGVNAGSIDKSISHARHPGPDAMVKSALREVRLLEKYGFKDIIISMKSSDVLDTINAYEKLAGLVNYPFHIGITEAGFGMRGTVKSSVGLGVLLYKGIGDTIRISLSDDPVSEVKVGFEILKSLGLRKQGIEIISCPTCARCEFDVLKTARKIQKLFGGNIDCNIKIAVMGCVVNGPGEARGADIGLAGGKKFSVIFKSGKIVKKIRTDRELDNVFIDEIKKFLVKH